VNRVHSDENDAVTGSMPVRTQPSWERDTEAVLLPDSKKPWFVLLDDDRQEGPLTLAVLSTRIRQGSIQRDTYLWQKGMGDWEPAGQIRQLGTLWKNEPVVSLTPPAGEELAFDLAEASDALSEAHRQSALGLTPAPFPFPVPPAAPQPPPALRVELPKCSRLFPVPHLCCPFRTTPRGW